MPIAAGHLAGAKHARAWRLAGIFALALAAAGCTTDGQPTASFASARSATVAFESIDGPPQPVFQKLVENLATEAVARQVAVISRESTPQYRVRGYMAAHIAGRRIHIGWVWDVYDANKRRVLRIANEELGGRSGGDAWAAADEAMLRRIARTGIDRLAVFLDGSPASRPAAEPADEDRVAAAGDGPPAAGFMPVRQAADASTLPVRRAQRSAEAPALEAALALADTRH
jgi:hypothetical protein